MYRALAARAATLAMLAALCSCAPMPHALSPRDAAAPTGARPMDTPGVVVGLAFSGGGSRAATFSAAVMRELAGIAVPGGAAPQGLLERPLYLSAVSGGSLSAAYYAMDMPDCEGPMAASGKLSDCYQQFFDHYVQEMERNWEPALFESALGDAIPRADAMAQRWDEAVFHGATFADLARRERQGRAPWLILNGTSWDTGRRFVFTTLPAASFDYDFLQRVHRAIVARDQPGVDRVALDRLFDLDARRFVPMTFEEVNADPAPLRLTLAIASSSSVPVVMGPVTFSVHEQAGDRILRIGDGGMFDNQGIESLAQVVFPLILASRSAAGTPGRRGLMVVVDASYPFEGDDVYRRKDDLVEMLGKSPARISDIMEQRARAYQLLLWESLRTLQDASDEVVPAASQLPIVYLRHTDAYNELAANPPPACGQWSADKRPTAQEMFAYLSRIPTRFRLESTCDKVLLEESARITVAANRERILAAMAQ